LKAAVLTKINAPLEVANVGLTKLQFGQVLVRVLASGICGAQLQEIRGEKGNAGHLPHLLGHEGVGMVEDVGTGVSRVESGDKVCMHWRQASGIESAFPQYRYKGATIRSGRVTTFSEYAICSENRVTPVPEETPNELVALLGCGLSTALGTVENEADLKMGESVLIIGCGGLGANLIRAARLRMASPIYSADQHEEKRAHAAELGADWFYNTSEREWYKDETLAEGVDVIIDTAGSAKAMTQALPLLKPSGRYVMVGQPKPLEAVTMLGARHMFDGAGKTIKATQGGGFCPELDIPRYVRMYRTRQINMHGIITDRIPLDRINDGIALVSAGKAGRVLVEMT
jgi:S-(hydroxymethyl)glutathione dehydrogenase/alcohol dehydrogenase